MSVIPPNKNIKVFKVAFCPLQIKILKMCLDNDDRVQSFYAKELFECINLADVFRKQIRVKLSRLLKVSYDEVRDVIAFTEYKWIIKKNGKKARIGIYRIDDNWKSRVAKLLNSNRHESQKRSN